MSVDIDFSFMDFDCISFCCVDVERLAIILKIIACLHWPQDLLPCYEMEHCLLSHCALLGLQAIATWSGAVSHGQAVKEADLYEIGLSINKALSEHCTEAEFAGSECLLPI